MLFITLDGKKYNVNPNKYKIVWAGRSASKFEWNCKKWLYKIWKDYRICEEFPIKPFLYNTPLRLDVYNLDLNIAVEIQGEAHTKYNKHFFPNEDLWWKSIENDCNKRKFLDKNNIQLVEIYPSNYPISLGWLTKTYPKIPWPTHYPK